MVERGGNANGTADPNGGANSRNSGGGAGNPGGIGWYIWHDVLPYKGSDGTGGLLMIYSYDFLNYKNIFSKGLNGGYGTARGGSSGGGSINIFYKKDYSNLGIIDSSGGNSENGGARWKWFNNNRYYFIRHI